MPENTQASPPDEARQTRKKLSNYFPPQAVEWKPQSVQGNRALAIAYIDARAVMKRLDDVLGVDGWEDRYTVLDDGCVVCTLKCRIAGQWVTKEDVGGESDQKDVGDKRKASFSDAFKRAAVKFGVGRYLYSLPSQWVDYDPQRRAFARAPQLPDWAIPKREQAAPAAPQSPPTANGTQQGAPVTREDLQRLADLLEQKGRKWITVCQAFGFRQGMMPADLSPLQYAEVVQALGEEPDKAPMSAKK